VPDPSLPVHRVLLVEDDASLGAALYDTLQSSGYDTRWARDGEQGRGHWTRGGVDLVLLDLGLPGTDGLTLLRQARTAGLETPVLVLTARDEPEDRVTGLDAGADDYLTKPFHLDELLARCRALLRRRGGGTGEVDAGPARVDERERRAWFGQHEIRLTASEFDLLALFLRQPGTVLARDRLEAVLARSARTPGSNTLDVYVHRLRRKLDPRLIRTVHGIGYRYEPDALEAD
jgi:DNA-binding response OmpR family regulator